MFLCCIKGFFKKESIDKNFLVIFEIFVDLSIQLNVAQSTIRLFKFVIN